MSWNVQFQRDFEAYLDPKIETKGVLTQAIRYAIQAGGKRLRPRFARESANFVELTPKVAELFSFAIELVHLFSLIHDDLPCMDDDDFRRGIPTVHKKFDEPTALLAGDTLLSLASEAFLDLAQWVGQSEWIQAYRYFLKSIGSFGMIGGQSLELELKAEPTLDELIAIQDRKTGALFRASLLVPLHLKGIGPEEAIFKELESYATDFGFAFQIADDLDDQKQDHANQSKNFLSFMDMNSAKRLALKRLTQTTVSSKFWATSELIKKLSS